MINLLSNIFPIVDKVIDRVMPDEEAKAKAKYEMTRLLQEGELKKEEIAMSAIVMEASSKDKWTSRARPSFMYVFYILLLGCIPAGFGYAFWPEQTQLIIDGMTKYLNQMPSELWWLFGAGYLGYSHYRSGDKSKLLGINKPTAWEKLGFN